MKRLSTHSSALQVLLYDCLASMAPFSVDAEQESVCSIHSAISDRLLNHRVLSFVRLYLLDKACARALRGI